MNIFLIIILNDIHDVIIAYDVDKAVGCVSFKKYDNKCVEVKRVFICDEYRGKGISKKTYGKSGKSSTKQGFYISYFRIRGAFGCSYEFVQVHWILCNSNLRVVCRYA